MSSQVPQKIVLKSTTKISLNDRFTNIQKAKPTVQQLRTNMALQQQASVKNRRLAQQMANRPTVQAVMKLKKEGRYDHQWPNQHGPNNGYFRNDDMRLGGERSLQQRLGSNVKSRLTLTGGPRGRGTGMRGTGMRGGPIRGRGRGRGMMRGGMQSTGSAQSDGSVGSRGRGRGRGRGMMRGSPRGTNSSRGRGGMTFPRGRGGQMTRFNDGDWRGRGGRGRGSFRGHDGFRGRDMGQVTRGRFVRGGRGRGRGRGAPSGGRGAPSGGRGGRGANNRGGIRGRGRGGPGKPMTREQLDSQLDEYMSKTKGYLDAELDAYMACAEVE